MGKRDTGLLSELSRRRVFRVAAVYAAVAFVVGQVADIAFPALQLPGWTVTLVVALAILGFPVAVALAWVFDVGPEGIRRTAGREASSPAPAEWAASVSSGGDAIAAPLAIGGAVPAAATSLKSASPASVAVLPFVNLSSDPEQEYFSDGLTEELLNVLTQVPGLRVPARTSSFAFKGKSADVVEIGQALRVRTVLEGSVRKWKDELVITAQLVEVETGYHLWSDTYDRRLEDVFAIQREIARSIVQTLKGRLLGEEETPRVKQDTADPEAYQLFLKGRHFSNQFSIEAYPKALALFDQALAKDPGFARAWAQKAIARQMLSYLGAEPASSAFPEARAAADRALELDPRLDEAYVARGLIACWLRDFDAGERDLKRALELGPAAPRAHNSYGLLLQYLARPEEAIPAFRRAAELDPLWTGPLNNLGLAYASIGRNAEALAAYEQALELAPTSASVALNSTLVLSRLGRHHDSVARARGAYARQPDAWSRFSLANALLQAGEPAEAVGLLLEIEKEEAEGRAPTIDLVAPYILLGRRDDAFEALEKAIARDEPGVVHLVVMPPFDPLRDDPRWEPLLVRAGFPEDAIRRGRELYERRKRAAESAEVVQR